MVTSSFADTLDPTAAYSCFYAFLLVFLVLAHGLSYLQLFIFLLQLRSSEWVHFPFGLNHPFKTSSYFGTSPLWPRTGNMFCVTDSIFFFQVQGNNISRCSHLFSFFYSVHLLLRGSADSPSLLTMSTGLSNGACQSEAQRLLVIQLAQPTADLFLLYPSVHLFVPPLPSSTKPLNKNSSAT